MTLTADEIEEGAQRLWNATLPRLPEDLQETWSDVSIMSRATLRVAVEGYAKLIGPTRTEAKMKVFMEWMSDPQNPPEQLRIR